MGTILDCLMSILYLKWWSHPTLGFWPLRNVSVLLSVERQDVELVSAVKAHLNTHSTTWLSLHQVRAWNSHHHIIMSHFAIYPLKKTLTQSISNVACLSGAGDCKCKLLIVSHRKPSSTINELISLGMMLTTGFAGDFGDGSLNKVLLYGFELSWFINFLSSKVRHETLIWCLQI